MTALFHNWKIWRLHCMSGSIKGYFEDNIKGKFNAFLQWLTDARINVTIWKNMVMQVKHNGNQDYINNFWDLTSRKHVCDPGCMKKKRFKFHPKENNFKWWWQRKLKEEILSSSVAYRVCQNM